MVVIEHKGAGKDVEPDFVHPDSLNDTFKDIGVADKCQLKLVELRGGANNELDSDMDEGGEEDQSDEFNEEEEGAEPNQQQQEEVPSTTQAPKDEAKIVD